MSDLLASVKAHAKEQQRLDELNPRPLAETVQDAPLHRQEAAAQAEHRQASAAHIPKLAARRGHAGPIVAKEFSDAPAPSPPAKADIPQSQRWSSHQEDLPAPAPLPAHPPSTRALPAGRLSTHAARPAAGVAERVGGAPGQRRPRRYGSFMILDMFEEAFVAHSLASAS